MAGKQKTLESRKALATNGNRILITFTYTSGTPFITSHFQVAAKPGWMTDDIQKIALES